MSSMTAAVVGARERASIKGPGSDRYSQHEKDLIQHEDKEFLRVLLNVLKVKHGTTLSVVSFGCDDGVGALTKEICTKEHTPQIQFAEVIWYFHGASRDKQEYAKYYVARNAAILEITDIFFLLVNKRRNSMIEDIIARLEDHKDSTTQDRPFMVIDEAMRVVKSSINVDDLFTLDDRGTIQVTPSAKSKE